MKIDLIDPTQTMALGAVLYRSVKPGCVIFLVGKLGAGKTTLVRGFLRAAGFTGAVKSPTFTLVEEYRLKDMRVVHFDLYRLSDPEELEWVGMRDYLLEDVVLFVEWPQKGEGFLPKPDIELKFKIQPNNRRLTIDGVTELGKQIESQLKVLNSSNKQINTSKN